MEDPHENQLRLIGFLSKYCNLFVFFKIGSIIAQIIIFPTGG